VCSGHLHYAGVLAVTKLLGNIVGWCFICFAIPTFAVPGSDFSANEFLKHIKSLSSEELKGRRTGTTETEKAGEYIARQFREVGLKPISGS
jgi:hypothetical protein